MIRSVIKEYGLRWLVDRTLYSAKLRLLGALPAAEKWFEKKTAYPQLLDIFDIDIKALSAFLHEKLSDEDKRRLTEAADQACRGIITGFSSLELDYGALIDWQLNPLTGRRCDEKTKWYRILDFDRQRGDIKVIWEASRFSHFLTLARAFLLTGDGKYYSAFSAQLKDWLENNPYGYGANYKCGQECSFRMVNGLLAFTVFRECGIATDADASNVKDLVDRCYRKVLSNFFYAYRCIRNNHTISELMGIIVGAWCAGETDRLEKGYRLLDEVVNEQFTADGGYRQFSFNYQRLALQDLEIVLSVGKKTGVTLSEASRDRIQSAAMLMYQCQDESGDMPNYGANDGALVFPVTSCDYRDFRPVIHTAFALTTGRKLYRDGKHQEELIWFSGAETQEDDPLETVGRVSSRFADAGLFTMRGERSWLMIISNAYHSRPGHMDQLHMDLWIDGVNVLCDAGTYSYASEEGRILGGNGSHNTAYVDGKPQMNARGPFLVYDWTKRELERSDDAGFAGKTVSANGYTHTRSVTRTGLTYEITDRVERNCEIRFHTPCEIALDHDKAILSYGGKRMCTLSGGSFEIQSAERSLYYLKKESIRRLVVKGQAGERITTKITISEGEHRNG